MGGPRSKATQEEILDPFATTEPFKAVARRLGMSPNTLRVKWKAAFGEDAFVARGKKLQAAAAAKTYRATANSRVYKDVTVACSKCHSPVVLKANQTAHMELTTFVCENCRCDRACPVCGLQVVGEGGLAGHFGRRRKAGDEAHIRYQDAQREARWASVTQGVDYVVCLVCGHRSKSLARHLKAAHGITADQYRAQYGRDVQIRSLKVERAMSDAARTRDGGHGTGEVKSVTCPGCGTPHDVSKFLGWMHDSRCPSCQQKAEDTRWADKFEPEDYVTCLECGYRAENLTSHIQNAHPGYRQQHPKALMVALSSAIRDKSVLRGRRLSDETRQKMSENAGRWNKGLTKEDHPSIARSSKKMLGRPSWSKGLTAAEDPRLAETARKLKFYTGENRPWDNGLAANLTLKDFEPFMDADGCVDHHRVTEVTGVSWITVRKYIVDLGLAQTRRYVRNAADDRTIRLDKALLEQFKLKNGKVSIGKAMSVTGHHYPVIKRECDRHGLPTFHRHIRQILCLDAVSKALGDVPYEMEWSSMRYTNPPTGRRFRFDGHFLLPDATHLIVEFQGHQHYTFPNAFMIDESYLPEYEALRERDRIKREMVQASSGFHYLEVTEDEPYRDVSYLQGRLVSLGVLEAKAQGLWLGTRLICPAQDQTEISRP